jgi:hypothetical protein
MRISTSGNLIVETATPGIRVMRFARPNLRPYLDDAGAAATSPLFREIHDTVLSRLPEGWTLIINMAQLGPINVAFYRCLLHIRGCLQARHVRLVLCGLTLWHQEVFSLFRGPELFTIVSTEAEARRDARIGPSPLATVLPRGTLHPRQWWLLAKHAVHSIQKVR